MTDNKRNSRHQRVVGGRWTPSDSGSAMGGGRKVAGHEAIRVLNGDT